MAMREILKLRKKTKDDRDEEEAILHTYLHALGMIDTADFEHTGIQAEAAE